MALAERASSRGRGCCGHESRLERGVRDPRPGRESATPWRPRGRSPPGRSGVEDLPRFGLLRTPVDPDARAVPPPRTRSRQESHLRTNLLAACTALTTAVFDQIPTKPATAARSLLESAGQPIVRAADDVVGVAGRDSKAEIDAAGLRSVPSFGSEAPIDLPLQFGMRRATVGDAKLSVESTTPKLHGTAIDCARRGFVESFRVDPEGIEHSFRFDRLPRRGPLRIEFDAGGEFVATAGAAGVDFVHERGSVRYARAVAIDARGHRGRGRAERRSGEAVSRRPAPRHRSGPTGLDPRRHGGLQVQAAVEGRAEAGGVRAAGLDRAARCTGAATSAQPGYLPRRLRTRRLAPRPGGASPARRTPVASRVPPAAETASHPREGTAQEAAFAAPLHLVGTARPQLRHRRLGVPGMPHPPPSAHVAAESIAAASCEG